MTNQSPSKALTASSSQQKFYLDAYHAALSPMHYGMAGEKFADSIAIRREAHYGNEAGGYSRPSGDRSAHDRAYELTGAWAAVSALYQHPLTQETQTRGRLGFQNESERTAQSNPFTNLSPSNPDSIAPLSSREKFNLAVHNAAFSPMHYVMAGAKSGVSLAMRRQSNYGNGARGYFRRFGDRLASNAVYQLAGTWVAASALHQDPRYHPSPDRRFGHRMKYALSRTVITRGDDGRPQFNASNLIGISAGAMARAAWYPREEHRIRYGVAAIGIGVLFDGASKLTKEFVRRRR